MRVRILIGVLLVFLGLAVACGGHSRSSTSVPAAPTGLTAQAGNAQVSLTWNAVAGATGYNLYFSTSDAVSPTNGTRLAVGNVTAYVQTGLSNGVTYDYVVTAVNSAGESAASAPVSAQPQPSAPVTVTGVLAVAGDSQVAVSWIADAAATSYRVYYSTSPDLTPDTGLLTCLLSENACVVGGLSNGATYYFIVVAVNEGGTSPPSLAVAATPQVAQPAAPTGLAATAGNAQVALSWNAGASATTYNVYYSTSPNVSPTSPLAFSGLVAPAATVIGLSNGTTYYFVVTGVNAGGESLPSTVVSATPSSSITVALQESSSASGTLPTSTGDSLTFVFPPTPVAGATATITALDATSLTAPLSAGASFVAAFQLDFSPTSLTALSAPCNLSAALSSTVPVAGTTLKLAQRNGTSWSDVATFVVGGGGAVAENLPSYGLPGLLAAGTYVLYQPTVGTNFAISNLGLALISDGGYGMSDGSSGLQIVRLYDSTANLLATPLLSYLDYASAWFIDSIAVTPDASVALLASADTELRGFAGLQLNQPLALAEVDLSAYGSSFPSAVVLGAGDEALLANASSSALLLVTGLLTGTPQPASLISAPAARTALTLSADGTVLLARGATGLTVYAVSSLSTAGSIAGTIGYAFTPIVDWSVLGSSSFVGGRGGMALSPADSSRAVVLTALTAGSGAATLQLLTGLPGVPQLAASLNLPAGFSPAAVAISYDGDIAMVSGSGGLLLYTGVASGALVLRHGPYAPSYDAGLNSYVLGTATTLAVTLDNHYVVVGDQTNLSLLVVPFDATGFNAVASACPEVSIPASDQLVMH